MTIREEIGKRILFFDGGMGTLLQEQGLQAGELPETWNLKNPEPIIQIHKAYLAAGADIILANTFGANRFKYGEDLEKIVTAGVANAKKAVAESGKKAYVALDIGSTGKLLKPMGTLDFEEAVGVFAEIIRVGEKAGADLILIETMSDTYELKAAVLAAKENSTLPIMATVIFDESKKMLTGASPQVVVSLLEGLGVDALGINCGLGPKQMKEIVKELLKYASIPVIVNPNAGLPRSENGKTVFDVGAEEFAEDMEEIVTMGAWFAGGCCGTTPAHIQAMVEKCKEITPVPIAPKNYTFVTSYSTAVELGGRPVIIGERINPTGKSKFKQALRDHNIDYILEEGVKQEDSGAHILDVNVGLPEIDEAAMMETIVYELQSIMPIPLQIDTTNMEAMERALRIYNGKPMINSVNGKAEIMEQVFPLVKKYGGVVIALTLDENGIPPTAEGRLEVAKKIIATAETYGIPKTDLIFDVLAMTISAEQEAAAVTLKALQLIRDELGAYTSLGVSNISFGLPQRENINAAFFTMAMQNGLSAAIINPGSQGMMKAYYSYCALSGVDKQCMEYISVYSGQTTETAAPAGTGMPLDQAVIKGLKESAHAAAQELLKTTEPLEIINKLLVPALDVVGK